VNPVVYRPQDLCVDQRFDTVRDFCVETCTHGGPYNNSHTYVIDYVVHIGHCSYWLLMLDYTQPCVSILLSATVN
jgi:hypothetical protein